MTLTRSSKPSHLGLASILAFLFSLLCLVPGLAFAQAEPAAEKGEEKEDKNRVIPYVEYMAGFSHSPNQTLQGAGATGAGLWGRTEQDDPGYFFGGAAGARFLEHFRTELQIGFRSSEVENMAIQGENSNAKGDLSLFSVMANGYIDWDLDVGVIPFIGVGIGWGMPRLDAQNQPGTTQLNLDDTDSVFVWNAMVGGTIPLSEIADFSLGYRYIQTEDISYSSRIVDTEADPVVQAGQRLDYEYDAHEFYVSLRFSF